MAATTAVATEAVTAAIKEVVAMVHPMIGSNCGAARRRCGRGLETWSFLRIHNLHLVSLAGEYSCKTVCFAAGEQGGCRVGFLNWLAQCLFSNSKTRVVSIKFRCLFLLRNDLNLPSYPRSVFSSFRCFLFSRE